MLPGLQHRYPDTLWQYEAWARHGKVWSCGSPVAALEMVRVWMREYFWDRGAAVEGVVGCVGLDEEGSVYDYGHCDY
jgi:transcriptional regulator GlxA family with amidase domain